MENKLQTIDKISTSDLLSDKDKQQINLQKRLFKIASDPRTKLDFRQHRNSKNLNLLKFIEFCKADSESYVKSYLRQVQPFMIVLDKNRSNKSSGFSCVIDSSYKIPLWIEVQESASGSCIISFHEVERYSKSLDNLWLSQKRLLMLPDNCNACSIGERGIFKVTVLRGMKSFQLDLRGKRLSEQVIEVDKRHYEDVLLNHCNVMLDEIVESVDAGLDGIPDVKNVKQLSYTSYGDTVANEVSFLLDMLVSPKAGVCDEPTITAILAVKVRELSGTKNYKEIKEVLADKYASYFGQNVIELLL